MSSASASFASLAASAPAKVTPVLLELASLRSGRPYSRVRPLHRPPAGRKEPPPDERSLRIQFPRPTVSILGAKRSSRAGRARRRPLGLPHRPATGPSARSQGLDPRISSPRRSERCSFACGLRGKEVEQRGVDLVGVRPRKRCAGRPRPGRASRPWKAEILHWKQGKRTAVTYTHWTFGSATLSV